ncbi:hypothetical protein Pmani_010548 [Petrolisthes manimaculis]|uniref:Origin recognition complex subunit 6 n=1 Tax=Petrolisthes manimaculis TaxID=1843537 RepID=A0AAE1UH68_9EUCA|nr:hypothetical protein Pmani_010548 [Petrolisthes manimaculis]
MDITLVTPARKLGLNSTSTLRKAEELVRLLSVQGGTQLSLSVSARAVICLDTAAAVTGATLDKKLAIRLSGLTRPQYVARSQTVMRLLNLAPRITINDLCVTHSVTSATQLAQRILKQYEESEGSRCGIDTSLPVYQTTAVLAASKVMKLKLDKRRLFESSGGKRAVFQKLVEAMTKIADTLHTTEKVTKSGSKRSRTLMDMVEDNLRECSPEKRNKGGNSNNEVQTGEENPDDDFEAWKKKILAAAEAAPE